MKTLNYSYYKTESGAEVINLPLTYETFGPALGTAPIVLVNHALTGNSHVAGPDGWWNSIIGDGKSVDTKLYTVLAFNIPGNGYDSFLIDNYEDFTVGDIARIFKWGLDQLNVKELFAVIGGSLGGSIAWSLAAQFPNLCKHVIPIASDWKSTDWLIAQCRVQKQLLNNSSTPLADARMHAMTFYRSAGSFKQKFQRTKVADNSLFNIESWLIHHGNKLRARFTLQAYKLMNHLLATTDISNGDGDLINALSGCRSEFHLIGIDSDGLFLDEEIQDAFERLIEGNFKVSYYQINSVHGHDAFLIEYPQLERIIKPIFKPNSTNHEFARIEKQSVPG